MCSIKTRGSLILRQTMLVDRFYIYSVFSYLFLNNEYNAEIIIIIFPSIILKYIKYQLFSYNVGIRQKQVIITNFVIRNISLKISTEIIFTGVLKRTCMYFV